MDLPLTASGAGLVLVFALATGASTWFVTRWAAAFLRRRAAAKGNGEKSSPGTVVPEDGTIGILAVALPLIAAIIWIHEPANPVPWAVIAGALALAAASDANDSHGRRVTVRLGLQALALAVVLILLPGKFLVFQGFLPLVIDRIVTGLAWLWFINLYASMDGIDGLAGVETAAIGTGVFAVAAVIGAEGGAAAILAGLGGLVLAAAGGGFLVLNWHPARVGLSQGGALALGFLLGWLLITLATWGYWVAALILPAYYLGEGALTQGKRVLCGNAAGAKRQAPFCERAVNRGWSAGRVARLIAGGNGMLVVLAIISTQVISVTGDVLCLAGAAAIAPLMLLWMARAAPPADPPADSAPS